MDGAAWSIPEGTIVESQPKKLFSNMPVLYVTAHYKVNRKMAPTGIDYGPFGPYECPVYKYPSRTDRYKIFTVLLPSKDSRPLHWVLRGVALLCTTG